MWSLECKHQMFTHDGRHKMDDGQPLTTIAHHEHLYMYNATGENRRGQLSFTLSNVTVSLARGCHEKGNFYKWPLNGGAVRWRLN